MININDLDRGSEIFKAWLGAWIDTEGTIGVRGRSKRANRKHGDRKGCLRGHRLIVDIYQSNPDPLLLIQKQYGGSIHHRRREPNRRITYGLNTTNRVAQAILKDALPYLIVKRPQAKLGLKFYELIDVGLKGKKNRARHSITEEELEKREFFHRQVSALNQGKGICLELIE